MYKKDLKEDLRLRLSKNDMDFLRSLSEQRSVTISECIRSIIGEYRRSLRAVEILSRALEREKEEFLQEEISSREQERKEGVAVHGDTKTDIDNQL